MAGIAGISHSRKKKLVEEMLNQMAHRGHNQVNIIEHDEVTMGMIGDLPIAKQKPASLSTQAVWDGPNSPLPFKDQIKMAHGAFSLAAVDQSGLLLARDALGVRPLYFGRTSAGDLCFASEAKALMKLTRKISEFPPGYILETNEYLHRYFDLSASHPVDEPVEALASHLRLLLEQSILRRIDGPEVGCWLSGGLDSSAITALVRPQVDKLHTFSGGLSGSPDLEYARQMADFLHCEHHEVLVNLNELLEILPQVIYHLESFDALLVRSSLINYLVAEAASNYVTSAFSGEGGDELFGGYDYLKDLPPASLAMELIDITSRLHNTALQRVDRCANAHGLIIYVPILDRDVVDFSLHIPPHSKIKRNGDVIEKYVFRLAVKDLLPEEVLWRPKAKFWQGAGVDTMIEDYANAKINDPDFQKERILPNGWKINSKEELLYYRIFRDHFGDLEDLSWMGRTKNAPVVDMGETS